jgi:peptidoglycan hydrolase-like protein with peptidoglycan-binding domain
MKLQYEKRQRLDSTKEKRQRLDSTKEKRQRLDSTREERQRLDSAKEERQRLDSAKEERQRLSNRNRLIAALFAVAALSICAAAQNSRPRYSSARPADQSSTVPTDTVISVQMNGTLSSRTARVGDKFTATVMVPVYVNGRTVIPAGSIIEGRVTQVTPAKRMNRSGTIGIDFDDLVFPDGSRVGLVGSLTSDDPATRRRIDDESRVSAEGNKRAAVFIGGGGAIGAVLGGISGGGGGAVLGGIIGAGAGAAGVLLSKGEEAQVPSGTPFGVQLKQPVVIGGNVTADAGPPPDQPADQRGDRADRTDTAAPPAGDLPDRTPAVRPEPEAHPDSSRPEPSAPDLPLSSPEMVKRAQAALRDQGYYEGEADGVMNSRTSSALRTYQREHKLPETGDLDPQTAKSLGIVGAAASGDRAPDRARDSRRESSEPPDRTREPMRERNATSDAVMATVVSASANRTTDGGIYVLLTTQANTAGWRWFDEHVVNGDTLEVWAKAVRPTGMAAQVITRGRIEVNERNGVEYVRRVVIHSARGDQVLALSDRGNSAPADRADPPPDVRGTSVTRDSSASNLQRKAEDLLAEYQRVSGVRMIGTGLDMSNATQYREPEIELLFAIDGFVGAAQLYARLTPSLRDGRSLRSATLAMARQARRTDRVISTSTSRLADSIAVKWDSIRQDVLRIMQTYSISSSEIED